VRSGTPNRESAAFASEYSGYQKRQAKQKTDHRPMVVSKSTTTGFQPVAWDSGFRFAQAG
jgi:hypothetical protein